MSYTRTPEQEHAARAYAHRAFITEHLPTGYMLAEQVVEGVTHYYFNFELDKGHGNGAWCVLPSAEQAFGDEYRNLLELYKADCLIIITKDLEFAKAEAAKDLIQMAIIAETDQALLDKLAEWNELVEELRSVKDREMLMRKQLFAHFFKTPTEGVNTFELPDGTKIKGEYKLDRKLDEVLMPTVFQELQGLGVVTDDLIKVDPKLVIKAYRKLSDVNRKILERALTIKPGAPGLELIPPKVTTV